MRRDELLIQLIIARIALYIYIYMTIPICVCRDAHRICVYIDICIHIYAHHAPVLEAKQRDILDLQRRDELLLQLNISHIAIYMYICVYTDIFTYIYAERRTSRPTKKSTYSTM